MIQNNRHLGKTKLILAGTILIGLLFIQNGLLSTISPLQMLSVPSGKLPTSPYSAAIREERNTYSNIQLVNDSTFDRTDSPWNVSYTSTSTEVDMTGKIQGAQVNTTVVGNESKFILAEVPGGTDWIKMQNPYYTSSLYPTSSSSDGTYGCHVRHEWSEGANQAPSVWWAKSVMAPVNVSDYKIVSANVSAIINATVSSNVDVLNIAWDVPEGNVTSTPQGPPFDYVRFYVRIADPTFTVVRECAWNRTYDLGLSNISLSVLSYNQVYLTKEDEKTLIDFLNQVLAAGNLRNFEIIVGMDIYCADSCSTDWDLFTSLNIRYVSLNFTCQKKVDPNSKITWAETGYRINSTEYKGAPTNDLSIENFNATFNFNYQLTQDWPTNAPNAEIRIYINEHLHTETVKLGGLTTGTYEIKSGDGFDVASLVELDQNVTIQIEIIVLDADCNLPQNHSLLIDNVDLIVEFVAVLGIQIPDTQLKLVGSTNIAAAWNENFTVTANYTQSENGVGISEADISISWIGGSYSVKYWEDGLYNITCNTSLTSANQQYTLVISAGRFGYENKSYQADIQITGRPTNIQLFLNKKDCTSLPEVTVAWNQTVNITAFYFDTKTSNSLTGVADVGLSGTNFNPDCIVSEGAIEGAYEFIVNSSYFEVGPNYISLLASLGNYSAASTTITLKVTSRPTFWTIMRGTSDVTLTTELNVPLTGAITLNVNYHDEEFGTALNAYSVSVTSATLPGDNCEITLVDNTTTVEIDTNGLTSGVYLVSIIAGKTNYTQLTHNYQININPIHTSIITTDSKTTYTVTPNGDLEITLVVTDTDFNRNITGGEVTYTWRFGTGEFTETSPGIFKATIESIPEGENSLYISAYNGINYEYATETITIVAVQSGDGGIEPWVVYTLIGAIIGLSVIFIQYQRVWKYPPHIRKLRNIARDLKGGKVGTKASMETFRSADVSFADDYLAASKSGLPDSAQTQLKTKYLGKRFGQVGKREVKGSLTRAPAPTTPPAPTTLPAPTPVPPKPAGVSPLEPQKPAIPQKSFTPSPALKLVKFGGLPQVKDLPTAKPPAKPAPKPGEKPETQAADEKK